jgi:hypothetical protein
LFVIKISPTTWFLCLNFINCSSPAYDKYSLSQAVLVTRFPQSDSDVYFWMTSSSGLRGHRRTYLIILESADHALFKMVYPSTTSEAAPELDVIQNNCSQICGNLAVRSLLLWCYKLFVIKISPTTSQVWQWSQVYLSSPILDLFWNIWRFCCKKCQNLLFKRDTYANAPKCVVWSKATNVNNNNSIYQPKKITTAKSAKLSPKKSHSITVSSSSIGTFGFYGTLQPHNQQPSLHKWVIILDNICLTNKFTNKTLMKKSDFLFKKIPKGLNCVKNVLFLLLRPF